MKAKNIFVKLLVSLLIVLTLANFIGSINITPNYIFASSEGDERVSVQQESLNSSVGKSIINVILFSIPVAICRAARSVNYTLASAGGTTSGVTDLEITPFDIFFNRFTLLDADIFSTTDRDGNPLDTESIVYKIRTNTAIWYYAVRTIAIAVISIMLIWNLIRAVSKSTSADQKVVAKNALRDGLVSILLVMFMHIIVIVVLSLNDLLLQLFESITPLASTSDFLDALENAVFSSNIVLGIASLVVYALLNWQTLKYILIYIQRFLTIVLLIMISPIVPITYSLDRMRGGKGTALNNWLKELIFNVFVQSLHALVYAALVGTAMAALSSGTVSIVGVADLGPALIAVASMLFIKYAEKLVKSIFGFDSSQVLNTNIFADSATTIRSFGSTVVNAGARVATGGPMISFGKNVDGSHIGIGQVAQGIKTNVGNTIHTAGGAATNALNSARDAISNAPNAVGNAAGNAVNGIRNIPENLRNAGSSIVGGVIDGFNSAIYGENGKDGKDAEAEANATAEASATAEARASVEENENSRNSEDMQNQEDNVEAYVLGDPLQLERDKKQTDNINQLNKNQEEIQKRIEEEEEERREAARKNAVDPNASPFEKLASAVFLGAKKHESKLKEKPTVENNTEITEEYITETLDKDKILDELQKPGDINQNPELMNKVPQDVLEILDAIRNDDEEKIERIKEELRRQLNEMRSDLDEEDANNIETIINSFGENNPEKIKEYLDSLPENSKEKKYAELLAKASSLSGIDMKNKSIEENAGNVIDINNAIGIKKPKTNNETQAQNNKNTTSTSESKTSQVQTSSITNGMSRTGKEIRDISEKIDENNEEEPEVETNSEKIVDIGGKLQNRKAEAIKIAREALLKMDVKADTEEELISDFEARYQETAAKIKLTQPTMKDIVNSLKPTARREYDNFMSGQTNIESVSNRDALNAITLQRESEAVSRIQAEASRMGFKTEVESSVAYQATVNLSGKQDKFNSRSADDVLRQLNARRTQQDAELRQREGGNSSRRIF